MVEKGMSQVKHPYECLQKCNSDDTCKFWDYGEGYCRLSSNSGNGPKSVPTDAAGDDYIYGAKKCRFKFPPGICEKLRIDYC